MNMVYKGFLAVLTAAMVALTGCGGGSGGGGGGGVAGIGGTGRVASGTITGFGSIFVNDFEYEFTLGTGFDVDDDGNASENDLRIGMVVTVIAEDVIGTTATATSVVYDDDVEGPVTNLIDDGSSKRFSVLGTTVVVDAATTTFDDGFPGFSFDSIAENDVVEVSGLFDGAGVLNATYIEKNGVLNLGVSEVEVKGTAADAGAGAGVGDSFTVNGITVNIDAGTDLSDIPGGLVMNGMFVEAKGVLIGPTEINASEVELEDDAIGDNEDDASIEGLISDFVDNSNFKVAGQQVNAASAVFEPATLQLADGLRVEVEGPIVGGILIADEVEAEGGDIEVDATVSATSLVNNSITLSLGSGPGSLTVFTNADTEFEDETGAVDDMTLADIGDGDFLEVRGFDDGTGDIVATEVRRDAPDDVILQGPLENFVPDVSITVLGIVFTTNAATEYEDVDDDPLADADAFDALADIGDIVKVRDDLAGAGTPNGVADEVDLEE